MMLNNDQIRLVSDKLRRSVANLKAVYLFGSSVTRHFSDQSDVDIAILCDPSLDNVAKWDISQSLASILGRDVDLIDLKMTDTVHQIQIVAKGQRIYCANEPEVEAFEDRVYQDYITLNEDRREILDAVKEDGSVYG